MTNVNTSSKTVKYFLEEPESTEHESAQAAKTVRIIYEKKTHMPWLFHQKQLTIEETN